MKTIPILLSVSLFACLSRAQTVPTKSLIELKPVSYSVGWADMLVNASLEGFAVNLDGQACSEYIFAHAPSSIVYEIPPAATHFTAIGIAPQGVPNPGTWAYSVKIDRKIVFESRSLQTYKDKQVPIEVVIPKGSRKIELIISEMKDNTADHSIWAKPRFEARRDAADKK